MAESIDQLQIDINAQANRANKVIDTLCSKIDRLTVSMNRLDGSKLGVLANGVQRLGTAMQTMNNVKTADFTRLAKNLQTLNNLDVSKLSNLSVNVKHIATAFNGLSGMEESAKQMTALASGIKQLGYSSAEKAITNIPLLATAMKKLMSELSTAPKVSQNIIDMTNALAKLARTGSSSGKAANSLVSSFNRISKASIGMKFNLLSAVNGISTIRKSILQAMGIAGGFYAVFQGIKKSIDISSSLTEVQNVVDVTFGDFKSKIEDLASVSIPELGMSELTVKEIGSRFQAMGTAMGFTQGKMADMSVSLTRLAGDMASFYNVEQKAVGEDLESIFTGQTKPLRQYGLDLTEATLQEWAMKHGMDANMNSMSQMEKTMLRYQYVMANTGAAQVDFLRTQDTWANQVRILKENFTELASVIGSSFIHALKPLVKALNSAMSAIISFAKVVSNALGKIFGWQYEEGSGVIAGDYADAADSADDLASGTGKAADNAKKLRQQLQGIDELNVLSSNKDSGSSGESGGAGTGGAENQSGGQWTKTGEGLLKSFESSLNSLYELGAYIGNAISETLNSIDWNSVYEGARNFGSGLASFLNGLISPELFGSVGTTIAGALNTVLYSLNSFGETFDWMDFGLSIATGINNFFSTFDFRNAADTINVWIKGVLTTASTLLNETDFEAIGQKIGEFLKELDLSGILADMANVIWEAIKSAFELVKGLFEEAPLEASLITAFGVLQFTGLGSVIASKIGSSIAMAFCGSTIATMLSSSVSTIGATLTTAFTTNLPLLFGAGTFSECAIAIFGGFVGALAAAFAGWKFGNWLYENDIFGVGNLADRIVEGGMGDAVRVIADFLEYNIPDLVINLKGNIDTTFIMAKTAWDSITSMTKELIAKANAEGAEKISAITNLWNTITGGTKRVNLKVKAITAGKEAIERIKKSWDKILNSKKIQTLKLAFNDAFTQPIKAAWNKLARIINSGIGKLNEALPSSLNISVRIPTFATGGFPEDGWFRASHGEMIGRFDNGKPVVANNNQITEGISAAVQRGNQQMISYMQQEISELRTQNQLLTELLNKEFGISYSDVGKASQKYAREYTNRTGKPAYI